MLNGFLLWVSQIVFGLVQGLAEVFPISSSAHIAICRTVWASFTNQGTALFSTSIFLHLGTFFAILLFYRQDVILLCHSAAHTILRRSLRWPKGATTECPLGEQTPFYMAMSLLVTGCLGLSLRETAAYVFAHPLWPAGLLVVNGLWLLIVAWYTRRRSPVSRDIASLDLRHHLIIGAAQGLAVIPGLSRFGLTLTAGLLCGVEWYQALKLSFLLSLPTVLAAAGLELWYEPSTLLAAPILLGVIAAGLSTWAAIRVIRRESLHARQALILFGSYCIVAGPFYFLYFHYLGI